MPDVDPALLASYLKAISRAESGDRDWKAPGVPLRSPAGALFRMQVLPSTARDPGFGVKPAAAQTPEEYNRVGTELATVHLRRYGDPAKGMGAYHSGSGRVDRLLAARGADWASGLGPQGRAYVKNAASLQAPKDTPMEDDTPLPEPDAAPAGGGLAGLDVAGEYNATRSELMAAQQEQDRLRRDQFEQARKLLEKQRFGPSLSERLFALSAAIGTPHLPGQHGFGVMMNDIAKPLSDVINGGRNSEMERAKALLDLQGQYAGDQAEGRTAAAKNRLALLKVGAELDKAPSPGVWSDSLGRFVPKDRPVPTGSGVINGQRVVKYSDGTMRLRDATGAIHVYDAAGQKIGTEGATK